MFGEGVSLIDLTVLLKAIRDKDLVLQVKIIDGEWENLSGGAITRMIASITMGNITHSKDIRLRLFKKE
jgi:hypothetical protein